MLEATTSPSYPVLSAAVTKPIKNRSAETRPAISPRHVRRRLLVWLVALAPSYVVERRCSTRNAEAAERWETTMVKKPCTPTPHTLPEIK